MKDETKGLELGAVDYIIKPFSPHIVLARIKNHLALKTMSEALKDQNAFLEFEVAKRTSELVVARDVAEKRKEEIEASLLKQYS